MNRFWYWVRCQLDQYAPDDCHKRIIKAREILTARIPQSGLADAITRAVDALEGK